MGPIDRNAAQMIIDPELLKQIIKERVDNIIDNTSEQIQSAVEEGGTKSVESTTNKIQSIIQEKIAANTPIIIKAPIMASVDSIHQNVVNTIQVALPEKVEACVQSSVSSTKQITHESVDASVSLIYSFLE
jgi:hypothetical protein